MAVLSGRDAGRWEQLGQRVADVLEPILGRRVLAGRSIRSGEEWRPEALGPALRRARLGAERLAAGSSVVVRTDVRDFYPSIDPSMLYRCLCRVGLPAEEVNTASAMLEGWGSDGYPGLPVGPPASAVLSNTVLVPVDEALGDGAWLRWCDDLLIGVGGEADADRVIDRLDVELAGLGLERSGPKTHILEGTAVRWPGPASSVLR
ncbi:MAG TPA: RNA-directed DNA polymerase [Actinomycetota bacterium]|nr:RNA-directed DNA polymerase [Actinomycetota bacterium]